MHRRIGSFASGLSTNGGSQSPGHKRSRSCALSGEDGRQKAEAIHLPTWSLALERAIDTGDLDDAFVCGFLLSVPPAYVTQVREEERKREQEVETDSHPSPLQSPASPPQRKLLTGFWRGWGRISSAPPASGGASSYPMGPTNSGRRPLIAREQAPAVACDQRTSDQLTIFNDCCERFLGLLERYRSRIRAEEMKRGMASAKAQPDVALMFHHYMTARVLPLGWHSELLLKPLEHLVRHRPPKGKRGRSRSMKPAGRQPKAPPRSPSRRDNRVSLSPVREESPMTNQATAGDGGSPLTSPSPSPAMRRRVKDMQNVGNGRALSATSVLQASPQRRRGMTVMEERESPGPPLLDEQAEKQRCCTLLSNEGKLDLVEASKAGMKYYFSGPAMSQLEEVLRHFLSCPDPSGAKTREGRRMAASLLEFLDDFRVDRHSCLVGIQPSASVVSRARAQSKSHGMERVGRGSLVVISLPSSQQQSPTQHSQSVCGGSVCQGERQSSPQSDTQGESEGYMFARCVQRLPHGRVAVYTDVHLQTPLVLEEELCLALPPSLEEEMAGRGEVDLTELKLYIEDKMESFAYELMQATHYVIFRRIAGLGANISVVERAHNSQSLLADVRQVQQVKNVVSMLLDDSEGALLRSICQEASVHALRLVIKRLQPPGGERFFHPTLIADVVALEDLYGPAVVHIALKCLENNCSSSLDQLDLQRHHMVSGTSKDALTSWWLQLIDRRMDDFLRDKGFVHGAVPEHYCEERPASMHQVKHNLCLLQSILSTDNDFCVLELEAAISKLRREVYPRIEEFIRDSNAVIAAQLRIRLEDCTEDTVTMTLEQAPPQDSHLRAWIRGTIKDVEYLREMQRLEDEAYARARASMHIVPISGLALSVLRRYENEHVTVLDLWHDGDIPCCPSHAPL